jgi:O-acetyl-ADP-ribose deacetylase (regulator of RNase III)
MINFKKGNLFDSKCTTLVNTVNCVGVMGKGIALQFKTKYPHMFTSYKNACSKGQLKNGGDIWIFDMFEFLPFKEIISNYPKILCFATKEHWRNPSKIEWIEKGLKTFVENYKKWNISSIAFPKLGCTNGGLNWEKDVKPLMIKYLDNLENIKIEIYE